VIPAIKAIAAAQATVRQSERWAAVHERPAPLGAPAPFPIVLPPHEA
jgi:hypothetical protein